MNIEGYDAERDAEAVKRIWHEVGWLDPTNKDDVKSLSLLIEASRGWVARIDGEAECLVLCASGDLRYLGEDVSMSGVMAVTTSRIARKQGFASRLTARAVAEEAAAGAALSGLGMFEQGYYDRLGFGTGTYEHRVSFVPAQLKVESARRPPKRLTADDWEQIHACRLRRKKGHGSVSFPDGLITRQNIAEHAKGFGLGYFDGPNGELTHHLWCRNFGEENGPYWVLWSAYENHDQFLELLGVLKNLGDQVLRVTLTEPAGIQLQDLVTQPMQHRTLTEKTKFETGTQSLAYWQTRICDLPACLAKTHLRCDDLKFNLKLSDPIEGRLEDDAPWKGVAGDYVVTLGRSSGAEPGSDSSLSTLKCSVNAFTRMWLGVRSASGLSVTDDVNAPPELFEELDWAFRLPECRRDWEF